MSELLNSIAFIAFGLVGGMVFNLKRNNPELSWLDCLNLSWGIISGIFKK